MTASKSSPPLELASWSLPQLSRTIECPLNVLEEIRAFSCDESVHPARERQEVAGILFGTRTPDVIRVVTWRPIACEHSAGKSFALSQSDRMNLAVQLEVARKTVDLKDLRPLGWFVEHLEGDVALSSSDSEIYNGFFPESWQLTLVIRPEEAARIKAGFFFREAHGKVADDNAQYFAMEPKGKPTEFAQKKKRGVAPPTAQLVPQPPIEVVPREPAPPESVTATAPPVGAPRIETVRPETPPEAVRVEPKPTAAKAPEPLRPEPPRHEPPRATPVQELHFEAPSFDIEERLPTKERWLWTLPVLLALGIAGFLLYQHRTPAAAGAVALRAINEAQTVQLAWDVKAPIVRNGDHAEVEINDGGKISTVSLTNDQLHSGKMSYVPQAGEVDFALTIYPTSGDPVHDSTKLVVPTPAPPTQPPLLLPPVTSTPTTTNSGQSASNRELQQLREELVKERARTAELQNLVRILENRLGIPHSTVNTPPQRPGSASPIR